MKIPKICMFFVLIGLVSLCACALPEQKKGEGQLPLDSKFTEFKLQATCKDDPLLNEIKKDMVGKTSILDLMKSYVEELQKDASPGSPYLQKLEKLFTCGQAKDVVEGHFYGITLVLKKGEHPYGDFLNKLWSATLSGASPWNGKIFQPIKSEELEFYTEGFEKGDVPTFLGINCFKEYKESFLNVAGMAVLSFWMNLKEAPEDERLEYGYDKKGGLFIARKAKSVDPKSPEKEVFQLNYRWKNLNNLPPLRYLIDEIVEIAEGLYLGKLLFATQNIWSDYDPKMAKSECKYENYGYFLLMEDDW